MSSERNRPRGVPEGRAEKLLGRPPFPTLENLDDRCPRLLPSDSYRRLAEVHLGLAVDRALVNSHNSNSHPEELFHEDRISRHWVDG